MVCKKANEIATNAKKKYTKKQKTKTKPNKTKKKY